MSPALAKMPLHRLLRAGTVEHTDKPYEENAFPHLNYGHRGHDLRFSN